MSKDYERGICEQCGQSTDRVSTISKGVCVMMVSFARAVEIKGENAIKVSKEMLVENTRPASARMLAGKWTHNEYSNMSRLIDHGLIEELPIDPKGTYAITHRGTQFVRGASFPKHAIVSTVDGKVLGYVAKPDGTVEMASVSTTDDTRGYWEGFDWDVVDGRFTPNKQLRIV